MKASPILAAPIESTTTSMMLSKRSIEIVDLLISNHIDLPTRFSCFSAIATYIEDFFFHPHYFAISGAPAIAMRRRSSMVQEMTDFVNANSLITSRERRRGIDNLVRRRLKSLSSKKLIQYSRSEQQWRIRCN